MNDGLYNPVGTPAGTKTSSHVSTTTQSVSEEQTATAAAATRRAPPLIKPASDDELRRWLHASSLSRGCQAAYRLLLYVFYRVYFRFSVSGLEHVPANNPLIIVSNHSSHLDFGALIVALQKHNNIIHSVSARDYFFSTPFRRWASHVLLNALPFDRQSYFGESISLVLGVIRQGHSVVYFPEGSRTNGAISSFKHGIGLLAIESGVPVLPAYISGTSRSLPKGSVFPLPHRVHVRFGAPVLAGQSKPDESPSEFVLRVTLDVQRAVEALSDQTTTSS